VRPTVNLINGDCLEVLRTLADRSVQCCVTSPPYWGLRDYGVDGQIGLEATPEAYVARMVEVFSEVRRVLRDDGTCWVNLGDSYSGGKVGRDDKNDGGGLYNGRQNGWTGDETRNRPVPSGLKPKDLIGIPWRVAFALQADGWYLRSDIIWHKPNPMPESVRDRPTKSHEHVFLLSKNQRYFYDADAVREAQCESTLKRFAPGQAPFKPGPKCEEARQGMNRANSIAKSAMAGKILESGRNSRTVWTITPKPFKGAHFATFPPELAERCIKAGTSEHGACPKCGKCWERVVEKQLVSDRGKVGEHRGMGRADSFDSGSSFNWTGGVYGHYDVSTLGFRQSCTCPASDPVPCVTLDPFAGAGTVGLVSQRLGRHHVGIELNEQYRQMAVERIAADTPSTPLLDAIEVSGAAF
jgi:DNA modification methylase